MKIAVISNVTMNMVTDNLKKRFEVYSPTGYNTWQMEAADKSSGLYVYSPSAVFIVLYADKFDNEWQTIENGRQRIDNWIDSIKQICDTFQSIPILVSNLDLDMIRCVPASETGGLSGLEAYWEKCICEMKGAYVLPVKEEVLKIGRRQFYSRKMWYMGSFPYSLKGTTAVSDLIERYYGYISASKKKCLVVDLDNTLWGGVIGEDGVEGIELSNHTGESRFYDAQKCLKHMKENGVMLAVASKNNLEDVVPVFDHPFMLLKREDFVSFKVNWNSKARNIQDMADELNIGLDAFVLWDDNPNEREQMKALCPEVSIADFPKDTSMLPLVLEDVYNTYFKGLEITDEDREKTESYKRNEERKEMQTDSASIDEYLYKLEITADIHLMREDELVRVVQLVGKTNQFNTTTIRYSEKETLCLSQCEDSDVIVACMKDRFGNEGLTAVMTVRYIENSVIIEDFIMSCRVMGRKFEDVIMNALVSWIRGCRPEIREIQADYVKTAKNKPVEGLYDRFGFLCGAEYGNQDDIGYRKHYSAKLDRLAIVETGYKEIIGIEGIIC